MENILDNPKITVIIPSYNHSNFIGAAINSVLNQTYEHFELLIVDDASPDNSVEIIEQFKDKRIRFIKFEENKGAVYTLNYAINNSRGEYIALLNSDDYWEKDKLRLQAEVLECHKHIGAVFTDAKFIDESGTVLSKKDYFWADTFEQENRTKGKWLRRFFFELNCLCHPSILIRKSIYEKTNLYDSTFRQLPDFKMWTEILKFTEIHIIQKKLVVFRILSNNKNTSANTAANRIRNKNEIYLIMSNFFESMDKETFIDGFSDLFTKKGELTDDELLCEKAFMYLKTSFEISFIYKLIGIEKLHKLINNESTRKVLNESYHYDENSFFELTGTLDIVESSQNTIPQAIVDNTRKQLEQNTRLYSFIRVLYQKIKK
ncbi:glycosyltransferase [Schinkia azotoformans]|uniref:Glycosyl transferase family protein n=1 Tax=Schinkia azotoformans LMG 9581 TaxID=1131731 RepID=K6CRB0_SCHAZ|nr:glycosyltransferase [Schinkia azotoformans]EKN62792.1 glycosyl transferase family protein [Schinkia azotoformans LMG 9581]MEC1639167.1 glycosyltransferase [Schinkia azotoformans]MEC1945755.1 glycosyltransferase [Schinkia azotoformans]